MLDLVKRLERRPRESVLGCAYANAVRWGGIGSGLPVSWIRRVLSIMPGAVKHAAALAWPYKSTACQPACLPARPPARLPACRYLNQRLPQGQQRVQYQAFDLSHHAKSAKTHLLADMQRLQAPVLQATGIFVSGGSSGSRGSSSAGAGPSSTAHRQQRQWQQQQHGVLRTNCIDSLDRTNVGQFSYGMLALGQQLQALGISGTREASETEACNWLATAVHHLISAHSVLINWCGAMLC